ncbi:unnamed protein product (macronuclear) [Paramecium tetraurelia]|uniref:BZIP domain-containing protein n=1 Tax=Paramecium tetraurelia TaxID=5888 RepID=A0BS41_PARTE|nr:uncharacterized protein GSPATT00031589001 [Paramecium tetraurelia]CAK61358.1 unnamed protein product [Paramecium tetraurelia]|eukprot:XP_001428756.1 hypothetical protein (macronuclear) [Paramecium tetraurelia strain d4-2]
MLKQTKDKSLSQLIVELQQKYQDENDQSNLFQKLYQQQVEQESSTESSNIVPPIFSGSTGSQSSNSQEVEKKIKKAKKSQNPNKGTQDEKQLQTETKDKKTLLMIRNRISAQNSRDRKKAYLQNLERDFQKQSHYLQELTEQVSQLQQQLEEAQKLNQNLQSYQQNLLCVNCGSKQFVFEEEAPISVSKNRTLGNLGFSFIVILTIFACLSINFDTTPQNLNISPQIQTEKPFIKEINNTDQHYGILKQVENSRIKGVTQLMDYNSEYNYKLYDTTYEANLNTKVSFVNEMINYNKERAKQNNGQALAPLNYHKPQVDSFYCPTVYKYDNQTQNKIQVKYQDEQWIHLVIPKNNVNIFYQNQDKSIILKETYPDQDVDMREKYQEIWCQVKSKDDFYLETLI